MIKLLLLAFLLIFASPSESKIIGIAKAGDGNTVTIFDRACDGQKVKGFVELRDKTNTLLFSGCWQYENSLNLILIEWSDGDFGRVPLQYFKAPEEI